MYYFFIIIWPTAMVSAIIINTFPTIFTVFVMSINIFSFPFSNAYFLFSSCLVRFPYHQINIVLRFNFFISLFLIFLSVCFVCDYIIHLHPVGFVKVIFLCVLFTFLFSPIYQFFNQKSNILFYKCCQK